MSSFMMENLIDQENRPQGGGPLVGGRRGAKLHQQVPQMPQGGGNGGVRPVLGEISQNIRRNNQHTRPLKPQGSNFSIFCDESSTSGVATASSSSSSSALYTTASTTVRAASSTLSGLATRSNNLPVSTITINKESWKEAKTRVLQHARLVSVQEQELVTSRPALATIHDAEPMNTSVADESPMVIEPSCSSEPSSSASTSSQAEEWRVPPIEDNHTVDIFSQPEYAQDIYRYLRESEAKHLPKANYMTKQTDITHAMRSILVDWLVEVGEEYKLQTETLHLSVNYIDRFLSFMAVQRSKLQLVGAACMFIAAKYEEIYPPDVAEFVYITDDTYNKRQVLRMEHLVLKVLNFDLSVPSSHLFISKILNLQKEGDLTDKKLNALASYLAELALVDGQSFLRFSPSKVAASCVAMARHTLGLEAWPETMVQGADYTVGELQDCLVCVHRVFKGAESAKEQAVRDKYKTSKFYSVADLPAPELHYNC